MPEPGDDARAAPTLLLPIGTQVVTRAAVAQGEGRAEYPAGAVGVIVA